MDPGLRRTTRLLLPTKNIENNPMQSNKVSLAWMLYVRKHLTCRANHRHFPTLRNLKPFMAPPNGFWYDCRPKIPTIELYRFATANDRLLVVVPRASDAHAREPLMPSRRAKTHPSLRGDRWLIEPRLGRLRVREVEPASGARTYDLAVRNIIVFCAPLLLKELIRAASCVAPTLPRPPHPLPNVRDDRETPLCGPGRDKYAGDLGGARSEIFLMRGTG